MRSFLYMMGLLTILGCAISAQAQILIDETWGSSASSRADLGEMSRAEKFKMTNRMGIGTTMAGATGLLGLNIEINATQDLSIALGAGVSRGFQSFNFNFKKYLGGNQFVPYFVGGYSRWFSNSEGEVTQTSPALVQRKFLTESEKRTGKFAKDIIYPGLGIQFVNMDGDLRGLTFFAEALYLISLNNVTSGATAGFGAILYF